MTLLSIKDVSRSFGSLPALKQVSLDILENEFFALLGPSGCGKTTLLRILAGFEWPDSGSVELAGQDLVGMPAHKRPVNLMFQSYALFPHMTVEKNVAYGLEREGRPRDDPRKGLCREGTPDLRAAGQPPERRRRLRSLRCARAHRRARAGVRGVRALEDA